MGHLQISGVSLTYSTTFLLDCAFPFKMNSETSPSVFTSPFF